MPQVRPSTITGAATIDDTSVVRAASPIGSSAVVQSSLRAVRPVRRTLDVTLSPPTG